MYSSYCKVNNWHAKFLYATYLSAPTWLKWWTFLEIYFLPRVFKKKGFGELLSTRRPLFTFLCAIFHTDFSKAFDGVDHNILIR